MRPYDSSEDTWKHILTVRHMLRHVGFAIEKRAIAHDASKLEDPEKEMYDEFTPKLKDLTYGSPAYKKSLKAMGPALQHHYLENSHHPEHYANGVGGMSLLDLIEMLADWKAASQRHADGSLMASLSVNQERFGISDQLIEILQNTIREMGWANHNDVSQPGG